MIKRDEILQDWVTLCGEGASDLAMQNPEFVADVSKATKVVVRYDVLKASNVGLYLQTAKVPDKKYWRDVKTLTGANSVVLTRDAGLTTEFIENFLRWRTLSTASPWQVTFRIQIFLK